MTPLEVILWCVAIGIPSFRLWKFIGEDSITEWFRNRLDGWLLELVTCPWCLGSWTALLVTLTVDMLIGLPLPWLVAFGSAAVAGWLGERT